MIGDNGEHKEILGGLRILDFTRVLAGPYVTRILGDFGAEVIKVQSKKTAKGSDSNTSGYFSMWNRNKRSITLDMNYPEAREIILRLTAMSDVVIENFSPRVMSNWGLGYEKLRGMRNDLIMISMSAMGQTGPWKDFVAFGPTIQAFSGLTHLTSFNKNTPMGLGHAYADTVAALYAALAILAALDYRDATGLGQHIDLSEYEAMCALLGPAFLDILVNGTDVPPQGNQPHHLAAAPYGCYRCSGNDRWCVIAVFSEIEWQALSQALGNPGWTQEERFATCENRKKHSAELDNLLGQWTIKHKAEDVMDLLQQAGVPAGVVQDADDVAKDPQLIARRYFTSLDHPVLGKTVSDASPIRFEGATPAGWKAAPLLGEDNCSVLRDLLGIREAELSSYIERGIVG